MRLKAWFLSVKHRYQELSPTHKWCVVCGETYSDGDHY